MLFNIGEDEYNCISQNLIKLYLLKYISEKYNCKVKNTIIETIDDYDYEYSNNVNANFNEILFDYMGIDLKYMDMNDTNINKLNLNKQYSILKKFFIEYEYGEFNSEIINKCDLDSMFKCYYYINMFVFNNKYINAVIDNGLFNNKFRKLLKKLNCLLNIQYEKNILSDGNEIDYIKITCVKKQGICCYLPIGFIPTTELIDCFMELINLSKIILKKEKKGGMVEI